MIYIYIQLSSNIYYYYYYYYIYCVLTEALRKDLRDAASLISWRVPLSGAVSGHGSIPSG